MRQLSAVGILVALWIPSSATAVPARQSARVAPSLSAPGAQSAVYVARKGKKKKSAPAPAPSASRGPKPARIVSSGTQKASLEVRGGPVPVYMVEQDKALRLEASGPGKLTLSFYQLMPPKGGGKATFTIAIDGKKPKKIEVQNKPVKQGKLSGRSELLSMPKKETIVLTAGEHTIDIAAAKAPLGAALVIELYAKGSKKPTPVLFEPAPSKSPLANLNLSEDEDAPAAAPTPPPAPPVPAPEPPAEVKVEPPPPAAPANAVASTAAPVPAPAAPPVAAAPVETPEQQTERRIAKGEIRDALLGSYAAMTLVSASGERSTFHRVNEEASYKIVLAGPGVATVRLHRLIDTAQPEAAEGKPYSVVILENDVVLQQLGGTTKRSSSWQVEAEGDSAPLASEPREYKITIAQRTSHLAVQIAEAPQGMAIHYTFAPEEAKLSDMLLDMDEDSEEGVSVSAPKPTLVMEVDVSDKLVIERDEGFLGLLVEAGGFVPLAGGDPGFLAAVELTAALPFLARTFSLGVHGGFERHTLFLALGDPYGASFRASSTVYAVPLLAEVAARIPFGRSPVGMYLRGGGGVCYLNASRKSLGASQSATAWLWAVRGVLGFEIAIGAGSIGLEGGYLYAPTTGLGEVLNAYTPAGPMAAVQYRLGM